jgi:hypothetical protein
MMHHAVATRDPAGCLNNEELKIIAAMTEIINSHLG